MQGSFLSRQAAATNDPQNQSHFSKFGAIDLSGNQMLMDYQEEDTSVKLQCELMDKLEQVI